MFYVSCSTRRCCSTLDNGGEEFLNEVIIFVFFAHKKYYCSFLTLLLNHLCHMDYFNVIRTILILTILTICPLLTTFLGLEHFSYGGLLFMEGQKVFCSENLCSEDEWRSYGQGRIILMGNMGCSPGPQTVGAPPRLFFFLHFKTHFEQGNYAQSLSRSPNRVTADTQYIQTSSP